jgi:5-methylcytosine-specific restriction endonuclease McrA
MGLHAKHGNTLRIRVGIRYMHKKRVNDPRDSRKWRAFRLTILARDNYQCRYCSGDATTVDHVMPIKDAPDLAFNPENCVSACQSCNSAKGSRNQASFLGKRFTPPVFSNSISPTQSEPMLDSPFKTRPKPIQ